MRNLAPGETGCAACNVLIPTIWTAKHFDIRVEVWNPHRLYGGPRPRLHFGSSWDGGFEVISRPNPKAALKAFISYSWQPPENKTWVRQLVEELEKHDVAA